MTLWVASYKCSELCEFHDDIPAFYSRLQLAAPLFADIQQKSFSCKKVKKKTSWKLRKRIVENQLNNSGRGKTEHRKLKLCFLMQLHVLCLLINNYYSTPKTKLFLLNNPWDEVEGIILSAESERKPLKKLISLIDGSILAWTCGHKQMCKMVQKKTSNI